MASLTEDKEDLRTWERMMACCCPCGYVWFKEGTGTCCVLNILLGCFFGAFCFNVCHACTFIREPAKPGSPCDAIVIHGKNVIGQNEGVVVKQPGEC